MREILFRGKRKLGNEWIESSLHTEKFADDEEYLCCEINQCDVYPETVGQYTGLTDKNGRKIFEGDIVIDKYSKEKFGFVGVVKYNENLTKFQIVSDKYPNYDVGVGSRRDSIKILGNAYDNPELLKGE